MGDARRVLLGGHGGRWRSRRSRQVPKLASPSQKRRRWLFAIPSAPGTALRGRLPAGRRSVLAACPSLAPPHAPVLGTARPESSALLGVLGLGVS